MEIYKKLLEAKKEIGKISKESTNPFFKSKYFDINTLLEHVEPILQKNGLLLLQPIEAEWIKSIIYDSESGEKVSSEIHLPTLNDPQKLGSAITYYRRYTLQSLLALQADDDDANLASKKQQPKAQTAAQYLQASKTLEELKTRYGLLTPEQKTETLAVKDEMKAKLSK